jgi:hypothetical protein
MRKTLILAGVAASLAVPGTAAAADGPTGKDRSNAARECRFERGTTDATREAFTARYKTFGKCVSTRARDEARERRAGDKRADAADRAEATARKRAAEQCDAERGTTAATRKAFEEKYGTNRNGKNAFGKCVSRTAD